MKCKRCFDMFGTMVAPSTASDRHGDLCGCGVGTTKTPVVCAQLGTIVAAVAGKSCVTREDDN